MMMTTKQEKVLNYIKDYITANKRAPYIREIQEGCGIGCYKTAFDKLTALEKKGLIKRRLNKHRSIKVLDNNWKKNGAPINVQDAIIRP